MSIIDAIIIAIVEGITEFLPISSTGHMIITEKILGIPPSDFSKLFTVGIQLGAILAVVVLYWKKFIAPIQNNQWSFYIKLLIAVIPALVLGYIFSDKIDALLESTTTVAISLIAGGVVLLFIDAVFKNQIKDTDEKITKPNAFVIGLWQCIAMIPGVSRSAASIIGGMQQKLTRKLAAEFSFFLAVPTMAAATGFKLLQGYKTITTEHIQLFVIGNVVAFVVALLAIRFFIRFLQNHGFRVFGYYRIIVGLVLLLLIANGYLAK
ncbi:MAG: undecaprenyl-diphosphate phosphatase [Chitinophagaceae bacterium]|nr:undecaprenyl-diphosphate phosphatase [Chitinophagaceae bacterium]